MIEKSPCVLIVSGNASIASPLLTIAQDAGYEVHATYRGAKGLDANRPDVVWHSLDLLDQASIDSFICDVSEIIFAKIFFFSGRTSNCEWQTSSLSDTQNVFSVNVVSISYVLSRLLKLMSTNASVGLMSSISGSNGSFDVNYACSKAALEALAGNVSKKILPTQSIYCLAPLTISDSKMYMDMQPATKARHNLRANFRLLTPFEVNSYFWALSNLAPVETSGRTYKLPQVTS